MDRRNTLKLIHFAGTVWFMLCTGFVFILAMWQAGFNWLVIFSLSGYLAFLITLLVSLYLFAFFKGAGKGPNLEKEHPFTSTGYYLSFYVWAPLLGILAGVASMIGEMKIIPFLTGIALGTLAVTFLTWVIVDPVVSILETLTPSSREHRLGRLAKDKRQREEDRLEREASLGRLFAQQEQDRCRWEKTLALEAVKLAELLKAKGADFEQAEHEAVGIGVRAWQIGGLDCMRRLHDMAMKLYKERYQTNPTSRNLAIIDHISNWWDGIGGWWTPAAG
jgi:hypothetical protein